MKRTIFVGDIQGCYDEFLALLKKCHYNSKKDELILLGDMINRGSKSLDMMVHLLKHPEIKAVMGNHEYHFLRHIKKIKKRKSFNALEKEMKPKLDLIEKYISKLPMFIESKEWIAVHAGLEPGIHPSKSKDKFLCTVREIGANGESKPWFDYYFGRKWVFFGHWSMKGLVCERNLRGLDTGCVYGGRLSAWVFPDNKLVSVKAEKMYFDPFGGS